MATFNERLKELRAGSELTIRELADYLGLSKSSINMYERGEREPGIATLEAIADFFNVDMDYLLGKSDCRNRYQEALAISTPRNEFQQKMDALSNGMTDEEKRQLLLAARLIIEQRKQD